MMTGLLVVLLLLLVLLAAQYAHLRHLTDRTLQREGQFIELCNLQQAWIRRGEIACVDCAELGSCIARGQCERERRAKPLRVLDLTGTLQFIQE